MNDESKRPRTGWAGLASVIGGLLGALSRFRVFGREIREAARELHEGEKSIADELRSKRSPIAEAAEEAEHPEAKPKEPAPIQPLELPPGWNLPKPHKLPKPTFWPAVLAGGIVVFAWGPATSWTVSAVGGVVSIIAIRGWIGELLHESRS